MRRIFLGSVTKKNKIKIKFVIKQLLSYVKLNKESYSFLTNFKVATEHRKMIWFFRKMFFGI